MLYQDIVIGIATDRGINNGQPSLHARCLAACAPRPGETVIHVGAGTGYYTAVLARLIDNNGRILAFEIEPDLAARARENLAHLSNVAVSAASGTEGSLPSSDLIHVNAGATYPIPSWLDALNIGGRLIFPLTPNEGFGCMLLVRVKAKARTLRARWLGQRSYRVSEHGTKRHPSPLRQRLSGNRCNPFALCGEMTRRIEQLGALRSASRRDTLS